MDMMAPPPSEYPNGGWMSNLSAPSPESASSHAEPEAKQAESHAEASSDNRDGIAEPAGHAEEISEQETEHGHEMCIRDRPYRECSTVRSRRAANSADSSILTRSASYGSSASSGTTREDRSEKGASSRREEI